MDAGRGFGSDGGRPRPSHWIGVERGWEAAGADPLERLVSLPPAALRTHALLIGATGSGKTVCLHHLVAQDVLLGHSLVVLDLRGDIAAAVLEILARAGADPRKVKVLDLRERARPTGFDPLFGAGEPYFRALGVLDAVEAESDSWGVQLAESLRYALMLLAEAGRPLTGMEALFHDRAFLMGCMDACASEPTLSFWRRFDDLSADRRNALAIPVLNKVSALFATDALRRVLGHPAPMDLGAHLDAPGSVLLVSLAADELHAAGRMVGRLVLSSLCREVFSRVGVPESRRNPVRLYVDEFEHFGTQEFETILAEGRRFGLSLVLAHQTLAQLAPRMRSLVLGNVGVKLAFRCGREDAATLSKDLTGDPRALDLASQRPGECVLWTREGGCLGVEVNAPIVRDVGAASERARRFLRAVQDHSAPSVQADRAERLGSPHGGTEESPVQGPAHGRAAKVARVRPPREDAGPERENCGAARPGSALEDWLS